MKIRTLKHRILARMAFDREIRRYYAAFDQGIKKTVERLREMTQESEEARIRRGQEFDIFWNELIKRQAVRQLVEPSGDEFTVVDSVEDVVQASIEFSCHKVKDGILVDAFDTREEALELVKKHIRQKKAKLYVVDSSTGEMVLFSEDEMAMV